jgi:hypothetical protein
LWLAGRVGSVRIGAEVMVERDDFAEDDHDMLSGGRGGDWA